MGTVCVDSLNFFRQGPSGNTFKAAFGCAIVIENPLAFKSVYESAISDLNESYGLKTETKAITGRTILGSLGFEDGTNYLADFVTRVDQHVDKVWVFYTVVPPSKVPVIRAYKGTKELRPIEFIEKLQGYYPHAMAWRLAHEYTNWEKATILLDGFEGDETQAWYELRKHPGLRILPHGDECNPYVSSADLITKFLDVTMQKNKYFLSVEGVTRAFPSGKYTCISLFDLPWITPTAHNAMATQDFFSRPLYSVLTSGGIQKERMMVESSPTYLKILNLAYESGGCVKFFDNMNPGTDVKALRTGDYIVTFGSQAEDTAKYIKENLVKGINIVKATDL
jgi:hypothetical protein